ncbi:CHAP domain-containing protein [Blastomonas sp.]|uniref:CHAP domain-containing protein n=1 Tax=Blastomonas sp. TaxID=1909299 RepID=UPI002631C4BE|nr:CHAP domain-containing protein [Blastomonas sp.]MDM7957795.1 CHAP domain-containing protein [Blastomonas sp.]
MLQCVPYARQVSGIQIYGDAHSWWQQAAGRYERGQAPAPGAVMAFKPHRAMQLGHVAAVSKVIDSRRVLLNHANWSPINGRKGQIERDVLAEDVSAANDWSEVRVWYTPIGGLGTTRYPVHGFIYPQGRAPSRLQTPPVQLASAGQPTRGLSNADRKAQRQAEKRAEKEARKQLKQIEKQRREYAKYVKQQDKLRRDTARASSPALSSPPADPIGDLIGKLGG